MFLEFHFVILTKDYIFIQTARTQQKAFFALKRFEKRWVDFLSFRFTWKVLFNLKGHN